MDPLEPMRCARCAGPLAAQAGRHGLVWVCADCAAGATTLGVLRHVAPRAFINHLWQAARLHGEPSRKACPSCTQPLLELRPPKVEIEPALEVCCRCFLIWMERATLAALRVERPGRARPALALAAGEIVDALGALREPPR